MQYSLIYVLVKSSVLVFFGSMCNDVVWFLEVDQR